MVQATINKANNTIVFTGFNADAIGAVTYASFNNLSSQVTGQGNQLAQVQSDISGMETYTTYLDNRIDNLNPTAVKLSSINQRQNGEIELNAGTFVDGQLTAYATIESRISEHGFKMQPWSESTKESIRFDIWANANTKTYEISVFRSTTGTTGPVALAIYRTNGLDTINHWFSANGNSYLSANIGNVGIGTNNPLDKLQINGGFVRCASGLKLGSNANQLIYAAVAPTSGTYQRGDIVINNAPSAGGFLGWTCVTAGTPGTWKTFGVISA